MTPEIIRNIIEAEIKDNWSFTNLHGVKLKACLLEKPVLQSYGNSWHDKAQPESEANPRTVQLWLVLRENPRGETGYSIVYNAKENVFGLSNDGTFIGYYGTFLQTFSGM